MIFPAGQTSPILRGALRSPLYPTVSWLELSNNPWELFSTRLRLAPQHDLSADAFHLSILPSGSEPQPGNIWRGEDDHLYFRNGTATFQIDQIDIEGNIIADWETLENNPWLLSPVSINLTGDRRIIARGASFGPALETYGALQILDGPIPTAKDANILYANNNRLFWWTGTEEHQIDVAPSWELLPNNPFELAGGSVTLPLHSLYVPFGVTTRNLIVGPAINTYGAIEVLDGPEPDLDTLHANTIYATNNQLFWWNGATAIRVDSSSVVWNSIIDNPWVFSGPTLALTPATLGLTATAGIYTNKLHLNAVDNVLPAVGDLWFFGGALNFRVNSTTTVNLLTNSWANITDNPFTILPVLDKTWMALDPDWVLVVETLNVGQAADEPAIYFGNTNPEAIPGSLLPGYTWFNGTDLKFQAASGTVSLTDFLSRWDMGPSDAILDEDTTLWVGGNVAAFRVRSSPNDSAGAAVGSMWRSITHPYIFFRNADGVAIPFTFPYGECASVVINSHTITAPTLGAWYPVDTTATEFILGLITHNFTNNTLAPFRDGVFEIFVWLNYSMSAGTNANCEVGVTLDDATPPTHIFKANAEGSLYVNFLALVTAGQTIKVVVRDLGGLGNIVIGGGKFQLRAVSHNSVL